jgi:oxygen-independent coproporphyrinogen-3 oxidase
MNAVYVHIPFCRHICSYCDFCKVLHIKTFVDDYLDALQNEIINTYDGELIKTLYIGGGTPSCLTHQERVKLFRILENFKRTTDCEYTIECNPDDITEDLLDDIVEAGVNRISLGVESFDKNNLKFLDRDIDYDDLEVKLEAMRKRGLNNINLDLMYAIPGQKISSLKKDLNNLIKLNPTHISTYSLIIEEHTKLSNNNTQYISTDEDRKMYDYICKFLGKNGYNHYEVSNFAKEGYESKHNLTYWLNEEYYGFGLGASGFKGGVRYTNTKNLSEYINHRYRKEELLLTMKDQTDNELMLGFRLLKGIDINNFYDKYGKNIQDLYPVNDLIKQKYLIYKNGYLFINPEYIYTMNEILTKLI